MTAQENHIRWEPLPNLPEHPCKTVYVAYDGERLLATAIYAADPPAKGLLIDFGEVNAFKVYEEFSDPWMEDCLPQPMIENSNLNPWVWPLQQVIRSRWIERVTRRNSGIESFAWKHYIVVTQDVTLHVMTAEGPTEVKLIP